MMDREFDLKLRNGKWVTWLGKDGMDAARRYVDCFRSAVVVAWREHCYGLFIGYTPGSIIE